MPELAEYRAVQRVQTDDYAFYGPGDRFSLPLPLTGGDAAHLAEGRIALVETPKRAAKKTTQEA